MKVCRVAWALFYVSSIDISESLGKSAERVRGSFSKNLKQKSLSSTLEQTFPKISWEICKEGCMIRAATDRNRAKTVRV